MIHRQSEMQADELKSFLQSRVKYIVSMCNASQMEDIFWKHAR